MAQLAELSAEEGPKPGQGAKRSTELTQTSPFDHTLGLMDQQDMRNHLSGMFQLPNEYH